MLFCLLESFKECPLARKLLIVMGLVIAIAFISAAWIVPPDSEACGRRRGGFQPMPVYHYPPPFFAQQAQAAPPPPPPVYYPPPPPVYYQPPAKPEGPVPSFREDPENPGRLIPIHPSNQPPGMGSAILKLKVPPASKVYIEGRLTEQTGPNREFVSPPIDMKKDSYYTVKVEVTRPNGRVDTKTEQLRVRGGTESEYTINVPPPAPPPKQNASVASTPPKQQKSPTPSSAKKEENFIPLFNGRNLVNWLGQKSFWTSNGEELLCSERSSIYTEKSYEHFVLLMEYRQKDEGCAAVILQGVTVGTNPVRVCLVDPKHRGRPKTGMFAWFEADSQGRPTMKTAGGNLQSKIKGDDWNEIRIECGPAKVQVWVNGELVPQSEELANAKSFKVAPGKISLINMGEAEIKIRKMEIKEQPAAAVTRSR